MADDPRDRTSALGCDAVAPEAQRRRFDRGSEVELERISPHATEPSPEPQVGLLLEAPAAGSRLRIRIGRRKVFATSPVTSLAWLGATALQVSTRNSVYRLRLRTPADAPAPRPTLQRRMLARIRALHAQARLRAHGNASAATGLVAPLPPAPAEEPFGAGAWVHACWARAERPQKLGVGRLLDPPAVGEAMRLAIDQGPTLVTTAVRSVRQLAPDALEVETKNTTYTLRAVAVAKPDPPESD